VAAAFPIEDQAVWRSRRNDNTLDDVIEILNGLATTLMTIGSRIEEIFVLVGGEDDETDS